jgi:hypothetical protein
MAVAYFDDVRRRDLPSSIGFRYPSAGRGPGGLDHTGCGNSVDFMGIGLFADRVIASPVCCTPSHPFDREVLLLGEASCERCSASPSLTNLKPWSRSDGFRTTTDAVPILEDAVERVRGFASDRSATQSR